MACLADVAPGRVDGRAMGVLAAMSALGTALGPTLGGMLIAGFGWRAIFFINIPAGVCALALGWRSLPGADSAAPHRVQPALAGPALLATSLVLYGLAMTGTTFSAAWLASAAVAATVFVRQQSRSASPLVQAGALRQSGLANGCGMHLLTATVLMATLVVGPFHLSGVLELGLLEIGLVMSCGPLVVAIAGVPAGILVDRYGDSASTLAGLIIMTCACLALAVAPARLGIAGYVVPLTVFTAGYALFQTANNSAVMARSGADQRGAVSGLLTLARNLGLMTGASLMGNVFAAGASSGRGLLATFGVGTLLLAAAIVLCLRTMRATRPNASAGNGVLRAPGCKK
jgi:predicted MFS family arabinose efflux permease